MADFRTETLAVSARDGHSWQLLAVVPPRPEASLLWLPALGVAARHYQPFAQALAARGIAVFLHEWRGNGTSSWRAARDCDWGYRELLTLDLAASEARVLKRLPGPPRILGGHSLGGQLACCRLAWAPDAAERLWLVAAGSPYWRAYPWRQRWWLPLAYRFLPWLAGRLGALPGPYIGFAGNESRTVMADWASTALSGRYAARWLEVDLEEAMARTTPEITSVLLADDWLAPVSSLNHLLAKMPQARRRTVVLGEADLQMPPDHFRWMQQPGPVAEALMDFPSSLPFPERRRVPRD